MSSITSGYKAQSLRGSAMTSQFRWPFSLRYLYTVDELRPSSQPPLSKPIAASQRSNQHHTFEWPFSLKYLYTVDEFRLGSSSTPPSLSSVVADVPTLPGKRGSTSVEVEATPVASSSRKRKTPYAYAIQANRSDVEVEQSAAERMRAKEVQAKRRRYVTYFLPALLILLLALYLPSDLVTPVILVIMSLAFLIPTISETVLMFGPQSRSLEV